MKRNKTIFAFLLSLVFMLSLVCVPAAADSANISCSSSVFAGDTFSVTVTFDSTSNSGTGAVDANLTYDASVLQGVSNPAGTSGGNGNYQISWFATSEGVHNVKFTFTFKALKAGSSGISVTSSVTSFDLAETNSPSSNVRVYVTDKASLSSNANLKSLVLSSGSLSPAFKPSVTTYNVSVDNSVTQVLVSATTEESAAKISVEGSSKMQVGKNVRKVIVTAPNGSQKTYTINITRAAAGETVSTPSSEKPPAEPTVNPYEITVDGEKKYLANDYSAIEIPQGFSQVTVNINGTDMPALMDAVNDKTLVYASDEDGKAGRLYLYDKETNTFSVYRYFMTNAVRYVVHDYQDKKAAPSGYYYTTVEINGYKVGGFKYSDASFADFSLFYGETADGQKGFYRYDAKDGSVQRAPEFGAALAAMSNSGSDKNIMQKFSDLSIKNKIVIICGIAAILLIIALAVMLIVRSVKAKHEATAEGVGEPELEGVQTNSSVLYMGEFSDNLYENNNREENKADNKENPVSDSDGGTDAPDDTSKL